MPYTKRQPYKRRNYKRKPAQPSYGGCAKMVAGDAYKLYKTISPYLPFNAEYKQLRDTMVSETIGSTGTYKLLNNCAKGTNATNRIGRSIRVTSVQAKLDFYSLSTDSEPHFIRMVLLVDKFPDEAQFDDTEVWESGFSPCALRANENKHKFEILYDYKFVLNKQGTSNNVRSINLYRKLPKFLGRTEYDASDLGTIGDMTRNALWLCFTTSQNTASIIVNADIKTSFLDN